MTPVRFSAITLLTLRSTGGTQAYGDFKKAAVTADLQPKHEFQYVRGSETKSLLLSGPDLLTFVNDFLPTFWKTTLPPSFKFPSEVPPLKAAQDYSPWTTMLSKLPRKPLDNAVHAFYKQAQREHKVVTEVTLSGSAPGKPLQLGDTLESIQARPAKRPTR